eukprot:Skav224817  [mRNA]  locus=scaffold21:147431:151918:- [translate_table: standard]
MDSLTLEPQLDSAADGTRATMIVHIRLRLDSCVIAKTDILGQQVFLTGLPENQSKFSIFDAVVMKRGSQIWLEVDSQTSIIAHAPFQMKQPLTAVETCSGIGVGGLGLHSLGFETKCYNDVNPRYCDWLKARTDVPVVQGDLTDHSTIVEIANIVDDVNLLMSGVACQPFSSLGDQRQQHDPRARTFPGTLKMGYHLQVQWILLECTKEARFSQWAQRQIQDFCAQTGYQCNQQLLELHHVWAGHRTRWWCVLTHPSLPACEIPAMPQLPFTPSMFHVIPRPLDIPDDQAIQLELDQVEFEGFNDNVKGYFKHLVDFTKPLPTATHSWGSQMRRCECGCRSSGFHPTRLREKGLYGALCHMDGRVFLQHTEHPRLRHLHPQEVGVLSGMPPSHVTPQSNTPLRLDLSGVGQMASPLQSNWVMSNALFALHTNGFPCVSQTPEKALWKVIQHIENDRDQVWHLETRSVAMNILHEALRNLLDPPNPSPDDVLFHDTVIRALEPSEPCPDTVESAVPDPTPAMLEAEVPASSSPITPMPAAYTNTGGIRSFASAGAPAPTELVSPTAPWTCPAVEAIEPDEEPVATEDAYQILESSTSTTMVPIWVALAQEPFHQVYVPDNALAGDIAFAEERLHNIGPLHIQDAFHQDVSISKPIAPHERLRFSLMTDHNQARQFHHPIRVEPQDRVQVLWSQEGWVATDEMSFYLEQFQKVGVILTTQPLIIRHDTELQLTIENWMNDLVHKHRPHIGDQHAAIATAFWFNHHWAPLIIDINQHHVALHTTEWGMQQMHTNGEHFREGMYSIHTHDISSAFPHDCGFQVVGWIESLASHTMFTAITPTQAYTYRQAFELSIHNCLSSTPLLLYFGGTTDTTDQLRHLLEQHGVSSHRSATCASHVLKTLGQTVIQQVLQSPRPWRDLKTRATQASPPIQLVLQDELKAMVDQRIQQGKPFGRKNNKMKDPPKPREVRLQADRISIPDGLFQQQDGQAVNQITMHQAVSNARGIAVANVESVVPLFQVTSPMSTEGLAVLVLDHDDSRIPATLERIRLPVHFTTTDEPILITGALLQLGQQSVSRTRPSQVAKVEETSTTALRLLAYRDQLPIEWETLRERPVKLLLQMLGQTDEPSMVLDVWDRQWLDLNFRKSPQKDAQLFAVTIRIRTDGLTQFVDQNAKQGLFIEPRTSNGRAPCEAHRVIWLGKKSFSEATVASQTTPHPTWVVRNGTKYGLRTPLANVEAVYKLHHPSQEYIAGPKTQYTLGPMPWGTTKQSLQRVFQQWGWNAVAGQPQGQSADHQGIFWSCTASEQPSHWAFSMQHGDIIISAKPSKAATPKPNASVIASQKTMRAIQAPAKSTEAPKPEPWTADNDPWAKPTTRAPALAPAQLATIEEQVFTRIRDTMKDDDVTMENQELTKTTDRVATLEAQVQSLHDSMQTMSQTVHTFQQKQSQHNLQVQNSVTSLKTQVDAQGSRFQTALDQKLESQMERIEELFAKRFKSTE